MIERQELYCHGCHKYIQFNLDLSLDGNHILDCPNCGHKHYRIIQNGRITGERWQRGVATWYVGTDYASGTTSTATTAGWGYGGTDTASSLSALWVSTSS